MKDIEKLSKAELKKLEINGKTAWTPYLPVSDTMKGRVDRLNSSLDDEEVKFPIDKADIEEHRAVLYENKRVNHVTQLKSSSRDSQFITDLGQRITTGELTPIDSITLGYVGMGKQYKEDLTLEDRKKLVVAGEESGVDAFILTASKTTSAEKIISDYRELNELEEVEDSDMKLIPTLDLTRLTPSAVRKVVHQLQEEYSEEELPIIAFEALFPSTNETKITNFTDAVDRHTMTVDPEQTVTLHSRREELGGRARLSHAFAHLGVDITSNYLHTNPFKPEKIENPVAEERRILNEDDPFYRSESLAVAESNYPEEIPFSITQDLEDQFDFVDLTNLNNEVTDFRQFEELRDRLREEGTVEYLETKQRVRELLEALRS